MSDAGKGVTSVGPFTRVECVDSVDAMDCTHSAYQHNNTR